MSNVDNVNNVNNERNVRNEHNVENVENVKCVNKHVKHRALAWPQTPGDNRRTYLLPLVAKTTNRQPLTDNR